MENGNSRIWVQDGTSKVVASEYQVCVLNLTISAQLMSSIIISILR